MDKNKKHNEGEMGSGDSDDEFYNVKLPYTPSAASDKCVKKIEVKKVYSPPRTKVQYDYKFDSSSEEESENGTCLKGSKTISQESLKENNLEKLIEKKELTKEDINLPQSTCKVVEKINEELKNMKSAGNKTNSDKPESSNINQNHITSMTSTMSVQQSQIGVVSPVVVVPPMVVPQSPVMNISPMIVPSPIGMAGQNILTMMPSQNMMGMTGNILRNANPMGGVMTTPNNSMPNTMMGINAVPGMIGMQGNIMGIHGNGMAGQGNVMGLQGNIINPAAVGGIDMTMPGNLMRMAGAHNNILRLQSSNNSMMGMQGSNNMMGLSRPNGNMIGMPKALSLSGSPSNLMGNPAGIMVNPGSVMNNSANLMVMGGIMTNTGNMIGNPNLVTANQTNAINTSGSNMVRMVNNTQGNPPVKTVLPSFIRSQTTMPANFKWQTNPQMQTNMPKTNFPTSRSLASPSLSSSASDPIEKVNQKVIEDESSKNNKDNSLSDKSPTRESDESQSPPRELPNSFKNDGSFMEMFKKMKEESNLEGNSSNEKFGGNAEVSNSSSAIKKPAVMLSGIVGKRRGGRVLKTGLVKKVKKENDEEEEKHPKDAWSMYMAEVKKYREASCEEEGKTRPLVK